MNKPRTTQHRPATPSDLSEWFHRACRDEPGALQKLLALYRPLLMKLANRRLTGALRIKVAASDLVQTTVWAATQNFAKQKFASRQGLLAWLLTILKHEIINARRRYVLSKSRDVSREQPFFSDETQNGLKRLSANLSARGAALCEQRETIDSLLAAIDQLPPHYQLVIRLRYFEQLDFGTIGAFLDRSCDAARVLHNRAIGQLRRKIND